MPRGLRNAMRWMAALAVVAAASLAAQQPLVEKLVLKDTIQPVSEALLSRALERANAEGAAALLIQLDTPGGLVDSMRAMAGAILSSHVPVIVYVGPSGARAGSAGFFLLEAADVAAMAPGTEAGAAHVVFEGGKPDQTMIDKAQNDAEAFMRSYVTRRNRNAEAAIAALAQSHSYTPEEALEQRLIEVTAASDRELLAKLDGRTITRFDGSKTTLNLKNARIVELRPTMREELRDWPVNPNVALLLLVGGALLIYLEFNTPGTIVPGALGTLMVLLGIFGLNLLPIRYTAVLLLLAAVILLVLEAKFGGHGALAIAGAACLLFGTLTLVAAPVPELAISPWVAASVTAAFAFITFMLLRLAVRARRRKVRLGADAMVDSIAEAMEPLKPEGHVLVEGEIWRAVSSEPVEKGAHVRVLGHEQYLLHVAPAEPRVPAQSA